MAGRGRARSREVLRSSDVYYFLGSELDVMGVDFVSSSLCFRGRREKP